ncbi:B12-binding domain-containing radical SAM protein [bacterium]|nr:B12-binding domain-containing radical SAM protein [candidate division CSSED10-310 bacterium]
MRTLLVKPYGLSDHIQPPLGLGYLATAVRARHDVRIMDCLKDHVDLDGFARHLKTHRYDLLGFQCYTMDLPFIKAAVALARSHQPAAAVVLGGPHPSSDPAATMQRFRAEVDYIFLGEAEIGFARLLDLLENGSGDPAAIPGLGWWRDGKPVVNQPVRPESLDDLGMPAWDLIRPEEYPPAQHGAFFKRFPIAPILTSRGCPFQCVFCAGRNITGLRHRRRSIQHIIEEMRLLIDAHGIKELLIIDDNFSFNRRHAKALLRKILEEGLEFTWATPNGVRMETLDDELVGLMKATGLYLVSLGIESGSDRVLRSIRKNFNQVTIATTMRMLRRHDIPVAGFFVMGFPGESRAEIEKTIRLALRLDLVRANFFTFLPFPGTESYRALLASGELEAVDWERFFFMNAAYTPKGMSRHELKRLQRKAFLRFFLRRRILLYNLRSVRSFKHFYFLLKRFYHWILMRR